ncbi:MAG TPA: imidazolonepropionase [Bacteroidales bacterium]|nr:imidazolonepropionase [Bacteroidales bacterium]
MKLLIINIKELFQIEYFPKDKVCGKDMSHINSIKDAYLYCEDGKISDFGEMKKLNKELNSTNINIIDAKGKMVLPAFCDSHTHIVFPSSRENEFVDKINGMSYEEIAKRGGGILNSSKKIKLISEEELYDISYQRIKEIMLYGTGSVEIKSGYGLSTPEELKILRVIKKLKETISINIKATFLGAHAIPLEYKNNADEYVNIIINDMLPKVAEEGLADYIDVFCEKGFFTVEQTEKILEAGIKYNLKPKIHANELYLSGGVQAGVKYNALSVDHLECISDNEIETLLKSDTIPTLLPATSFFLGLPYAPAKKLINAGLPIAMASDYNPGSAPSGNMQFVFSLACIKYKLTPEEALNAITINGAAAMEINNITGSIAKGKDADFIITKSIPSLTFMPYSFGSNKLDTLIIKGKPILKNLN